MWRPWWAACTHTERYPSQSQSIYAPAPRAKQAKAVQWLNANVFTTPTYFLDTAILRRIEPTGSVERLRTRQSQILNTVLNDERLGRLAEEQAFATKAAPAYSIAELLSDLSQGLFAEAREAKPVTDVYRRNLQRAFVEQMNRLINTPLEPPVRPGVPARFAPKPRPADARALARAQLVVLDAQLRGAESTGDRQGDQGAFRGSARADQGDPEAAGADAGGGTGADRADCGEEGKGETGACS